MILIIIKFCELLLRMYPRIINSLRSYIKTSKECFLLFPNTSKLVKKNSAAPRFSNLLLGVWKSEKTLFLVFDLLLQQRSENGGGNGMFWSEIGSGFGEPGGTPLPRIPRSISPPRRIRPTCRHTGHVLLSVLECLSGEFHECRPCTWPHLRYTCG